MNFNKSNNIFIIILSCMWCCRWDIGRHDETLILGKNEGEILIFDI